MTNDFIRISMHSRPTELSTSKVLKTDSWNKIESWRILIGLILCPVHIILFGLILSIFHLPLVFTYYGIKPFSRSKAREAHHWILEWMCACLVTNIRLSGARIHLSGLHHLEGLKGKRILLVSNHQSMYDIPLMIWCLRDLDPRFIAKRELARLLPSISFSLRIGDHLCIDRGNARQAIKQIKGYAARQEPAQVVSIFPEGTRARDGVMKEFRSAGFSSYLESAGDTVIVPLVIDGMWQIVRYKLFPVPFATSIHLKVLAPVYQEERDSREVLALVEEVIRNELAAIRTPS